MAVVECEKENSICGGLSRGYKFRKFKIVQIFFNVRTFKTPNSRIFAVFQIFESSSSRNFEGGILELPKFLRFS